MDIEIDMIILEQCVTGAQAGQVGSSTGLIRRLTEHANLADVSGFDICDVFCAQRTLR